MQCALRSLLHHLRPMSAAARPSSPDLCPPPGPTCAGGPDPRSLPCPPPAPPAAAPADEKRLSRLTKTMLLVARALSWVFGGVNRAFIVAIVGVHVGLTVIRVFTFTTDPHLWLPFQLALVYLGLAAIVLMACWDCFCYCKNYNLPQRQPAEAAAAAVQLPPPPPAMDLC